MIGSTFQDKFLFLYKYMLSPMQIGSVTPSSKYLASKMLSSVDWDRGGAVAELGAGSGAVTKFIHRFNTGDATIVLFEKDAQYRRKLKFEFPNYLCFSDAENIRWDLQANQIEPLDAIISGLPFFNFENKLREQLLEEIDSSLKPDGQFIAFQYSLQMKKAIERRFEIEKISFVPWNLPPAFVYCCRKK
ncbi:class I SAM-dependent methyltransferase [Bacillus sp. 03113]|uniref:class I SAM-dependent methyltransferase n=1 Tax=Bacillus sp. 03113 TaxID=2578211 RepID=UPI00215C948C|nr:methyltransferase [Bacillus sp. 03113]